MEELRDKLLERASKATAPPDEVKNLVEAALHLDVHIKQDAREQRAATHYFGLEKRILDLEKKVKGAKKKSG